MEKCNNYYCGEVKGLDLCPLIILSWRRMTLLRVWLFKWKFVFTPRGYWHQQISLVMYESVIINHRCPFCVQAQETAQLEEQLQGWGEVILAGDRVVRWEKPWFPGALVGGTTALFLWVNFTVYCNMTLHAAWCIPELTKCAVPPSHHWTLAE